MKWFYSFRDHLINYPDWLSTRVSILGIRGVEVFSFLVGLMLVGLGYWGYFHVVQRYKAKDTVNGAVLKEGVRSAPVVIHPVPINIAETDRDIKHLMYRGLYEVLPDGSIVGDLVSAWSVEDQGKKVILYLKQDAKWSDGTEITAEDVLYTIKVVREQLPELPSAKFLKAAEARALDKYTVELQLQQPYAAFSEYLTFPIMAEHYYSQYSVDQLLYEGILIKPLVSGEYVVDRLLQDRLVLVRREGNKEDVPSSIGVNNQKFNRIEFVFKNLNDWRALIAGDINSLGGLSTDEAKHLEGVGGIEVRRLTRKYNIVGLFINLNTNNALLKEAAFRHWLYKIVDRKAISQRVDGEPAFSIYPQDSVFYNDQLVKQYLKSGSTPTDLINNALAEYPECASINKPKCAKIDIIVPDVADLKKVAQIIQASLAQHSIVVNIHNVSNDQLNGQIIPLREFDMLLLEIETTPDPDQFVFWHSSQKEYPGLNIVGIDSRRLDRALIRGRVISDKQDRITEYNTVQEVLFEQMPFIPLYHPRYVYAFRTDSVEFKGQYEYLIFPEHRLDLVSPKRKSK